MTTEIHIDVYPRDCYYMATATTKNKNNNNIKQQQQTTNNNNNNNKAKYPGLFPSYSLKCSRAVIASFNVYSMYFQYLPYYTVHVHST